MSKQMVDIDELAIAVMHGLQEYVRLATDGVKKAVKKTATATKMKLQPLLRREQVRIEKAGQLPSRKFAATLCILPCIRKAGIRLHICWKRDTSCETASDLKNMSISNRQSSTALKCWNEKSERRCNDLRSNVLRTNRCNDGRNGTAVCLSSFCRG